MRKNTFNIIPTALKGTELQFRTRARGLLEAVPTVTEHHPHTNTHANYAGAGDNSTAAFVRA